MQVFTDINALALKGTAVTTGNFDGVHLGHQFLLKELVRHARDKRLKAVVVMFYPHPRVVLSAGRDELQYLSSQEEKFRIFESLGIDVVVQVPFDMALASWGAEDFIRRILMDKIGMAFFLVGYDHRIGNPQKPADLNKLSGLLGFELHHCPPYHSTLGKISSSLVRKSLATADLRQVTAMLGRYYSVLCVVEEGMKIGRSIGYPTANLKRLHQRRMLPPEGVYAVFVRLNGQQYGGMLQLGHRPTLNDQRGLTIEVHIFDFKGEIYGHQLELCFVAFLRQNYKFDNLDLLKEQLKKDEFAARALL